MRSLVLTLALASFSLPGTAPAQAEPPAPADASVDSPADASAGSATSSDRLRVFLDCRRGCDFDFLRTDIRFVDYVRDREDAHVHVQVLTQQTGAGGTQYTFRVLGQRQFIGMDDELRHVTRPVDSQDEARRGMSRVLKAGLVRYALQTPAGDGIRIAYSSPRGEEAAAGRPASADPWDSWVFRTRLGGFSRGESAYRSTNVDASVSAMRTTENWKTRLSASTRHEESVITVRERGVKSVQRDHGVGALIVKSVDGHFSIGARASAGHSTFRNRDLSLRLAPALEYNLFPYAESTRRQFTLQYSVGANQIDYQEETIFGKTHEALMDQALTASYDVTQPWGSVRTSLEGSHYFHDKSKYRLEARGGLDLRITRGVSINFNGNAERIRDQLHLVKGDRSPEEILLRQKQVATSFRYYGSVGLGFSFGSIYNSVVNPRFGD